MCYIWIQIKFSNKFFVLWGNYGYKISPFVMATMTFKNHSGYKFYIQQKTGRGTYCFVTGYCHLLKIRLWWRTETDF